MSDHPLHKLSIVKEAKKYPINEMINPRTHKIRSSTIMQTKPGALRKESLLLDLNNTSLAQNNMNNLLNSNQSMALLNQSSSPWNGTNQQLGTLQESITKGNQFTETFILPNANEASIAEIEPLGVVRRPHSARYRQPMLTSDSDDYFREDKDQSEPTITAISPSREEQDTQFFAGKGPESVISEKPIAEENEASPLKKKKSKQPETFSEIVTNRELRDPPRDMIFRWNQFLELVVYHIIYYNLGSFIGLLLLRIILRKKNFHLVRNLGFYGWNSIKPLEMLSANLFFSMNFLVFFFIHQLSQVYLVECAYVFLLLLQRAFIVSVKYGSVLVSLAKLIYHYFVLTGFMYPQKFVLYKTKTLTKEQLAMEYIHGDWMEQTELVVDRELNLSMNRLEIEKSSFYLCFIVNPSDDKMNELKNPGAYSFGEGDLDFSNAAYGPQLMKKLINHFNSQINTKRLIYTSIILALIKEAIFISTKLAASEYINDCMSNCAFESFILVSSTFSGYFVVHTFILVAAISSRHLKRILFLMNQLSHLISAKKVEEYDEKKLYPTLNLTSDLSIRSWFHLRNIAMDYGQKYYRRIEYIISFFFLFNFIFMLIIFLINFNVIPGLGSNVKLTFKLNSIYCSIWLVLLVVDIWMGAQVNKHFKIHKMFLMKNLSIIEDICSNYFLYFDENAQCENFMYRELVKYFALTHKDSNLNDMTNVVHFIRPILNSLEGGIEQIEFYEKYKPFQIAGLPVSNPLIVKLMLFILSLCGSVLASIFLSK